MRVLESDCRGFHLGKKHNGRAKGSSLEKPKGIRAWKCRIIAGSVLGIEIANEVRRALG